MDITNKINELKSLSPEQALNAASATLPPWIMVGLAIALAWVVADISWLLAPQPQTLAAPSTAAHATDPATGSTSSYDIEGIVRSRIFGQAPAIAAVAAVNPEDIDVNTDLDLYGVVAKPDSKEGVAIIGERNGEAGIYRAGEAINSRITLEDIYHRYVVILNGGAREKLELPREADNAGAPAARGRQRPTASRRPARATPSARQTALNLAGDPAKLTDLIRPQPVFNNGKQVGYRVYPGRKRQQFVQLGLKPGDLITDINGTQLDDPAKGLDIFRSLSTSSQVSVTVQRNGASQVLVLDTQQLADISNGASGKNER